MKIKKVDLERAVGNFLLRGWVLDGAGPARFGWYIMLPTGGQRWQGKTLREIAERVW